MDDVRLPDLEVIRRFSIAVRREHAPAEEVIAALRADLAKLSGSARTKEPALESAITPPKTTTRSAPARTTSRTSSRTPARKPARKPTRRR